MSSRDSGTNVLAGIFCDALKEIKLDFNIKVWGEKIPRVKDNFNIKLRQNNWMFTELIGGGGNQ